MKKIIYLGLLAFVLTTITSAGGSASKKRIIIKSNRILQLQNNQKKISRIQAVTSRNKTRLCENLM